MNLVFRRRNDGNDLIPNAVRQGTQALTNKFLPGDHAGHQLARQRARLGVQLQGQVTLHDGVRRALTELRLEHRGKRQATTGVGRPAVAPPDRAANFPDGVWKIAARSR